jgi:hypothetical protein
MAIFRGFRFKPDTEIGPFGIFEVASINNKAILKVEPIRVKPLSQALTYH